MARKRKSVEHLETLVEWAGGTTEFCRLTRITLGNLNAYLAATKTISLKRLRRCAEEVFGVPPAFDPIVEREAVPTDFKTFPSKKLERRSGVYALFSSSGTVIYFGKATNLLIEIKQTLNRPTPKRVIEGVRKTTPKYRDIATHYSAFAFHRGDASYRHDVEALVLRVVVNDTLNHQQGHFKRTS